MLSLVLILLSLGRLTSTDHRELTPLAPESGRAGERPALDPLSLRVLLALALGGLSALRGSSSLTYLTLSRQERAPCFWGGG